MSNLKLVKSYVVVAVATLSLALVLPGAAAAKAPKTVSVSVFKSFQKTVVKEFGGINKTIRKITSGLTQSARNITQITTNLTRLAGNVTNLVNSAVTNLGNTVQTIGSAVTNLVNIAQTIGSAVANTSTGLPGLNQARPLIGAVLATTPECTAAYGGTATTGPCVTPSSEFTLVGHTSSTYVLHFVRNGSPVDVSKRVIEVTPLNTAAFVTADSCTVDETRCTPAVGSTDSSVDDVLVGTAASNATGANEDVQVAAIAGSP